MKVPPNIAAAWSKKFNLQSEQVIVQNKTSLGKKKRKRERKISIFKMCTFLEEVIISPTIESPSRQPTNWRTIIPKKFSHCSKSSKAHNRFPKLGIQPKGWEPTGKQDSWRAQQNLVGTRTQEKGAATPQETEPDLPVSVQESLVEVWVDSGLPRVRGTKYNSPGRPRILA